VECRLRAEARTASTLVLSPSSWPRSLESCGRYARMSPSVALATGTISHALAIASIRPPFESRRTKAMIAFLCSYVRHTECGCDTAPQRGRSLSVTSTFDLRAFRHAGLKCWVRDQHGPA
jgi:hypothetical protein